MSALTHGHNLRRYRVTILIALAVVAPIAGYAIWPSPAPGYVSEPVTRGDVIRLVQASGKVRAVNTIKVGSEISGQVAEVLVDYNSPVRAGQILAEIDGTRLRARFLQAQAGVAVARAALAQAQAARAQARTELLVQARELDRRATLSARGFVTRSGLDQGLSAEAAARSSVDASEAGIRGAAAGVAQAQAELTAARLDLRRTKIVSPIAGTVINKLVEPGTTVAATFQTPNLFEIAADMGKMRIEAGIDEADVGQVRIGQPVRFTVDAYPDQTFKAVVRQIRQAPTETQAIVTYLAIIDVDNSAGRLLPGMTANVEIQTGIRRGVARIPVAALRFRPNTARRGAAGDEADTVWLAGGPGRPLVVRRVAIGLRGEDYAEVRRGIGIGDAVIVRQRARDADASGTGPGT